MTSSNPLVAGAVSTPVDPWAGVWIAEDIETILAGVRGGSWIETSLGAVSAGLDALAFVSDPVGALNEIHRCARTYIWGSEYYAPVLKEVAYRGHDSLLWKSDFAAEYLRRFPDLELVKEQKLPYLEGGNVDSMFLLRKVR